MLPLLACVNAHPKGTWVFIVAALFKNLGGSLLRDCTWIFIVAALFKNLGAKSSCGG